MRNPCHEIRSTQEKSDSQSLLHKNPKREITKLGCDAWLEMCCVAMAMTKREESKMKWGPVAKTTSSRPRTGGRERERERERVEERRERWSYREMERETSWRAHEREKFLFLFVISFPLFTSSVLGFPFLSMHIIYLSKKKKNAPLGAVPDLCGAHDFHSNATQNCYLSSENTSLNLNTRLKSPKVRTII